MNIGVLESSKRVLKIFWRGLKMVSGSIWANCLWVQPMGSYEGRYRLECQTKHLSSMSDDSGFCRLSSCQSPPNQHVSSMKSFLLSCPPLARARYVSATIYFSNPMLKNIHIWKSWFKIVSTGSFQFFFDCFTMPLVIAAVQLQALGDRIQFHMFQDI